MAEKSPYIVHLRDLPLEREWQLDNAFVRSAVAGLPMRAALERPADDPDAGSAEASLSLYGESENVFVRGTLRGWVEVACSRCIGLVRVPIDEELAVTFLPRSQVPDDDPEGELEVAEDDEAVYPYDGQDLDLEALFREQVIMAVPFAPLCKDDCLGLCPNCGANRNHESCGCDPDPVDPRLAALKNLKV